MGGRKSKLDPKEVQFLRINTCFTDEEIHNWYFWYCCTIGCTSTSQMDIQQLKKIYKEMESHVEDEYVEHVFRSFDTNGDNQIDFVEFMVSLSMTSRGTFIQKLEWAFNIYDMDKDGFVLPKDMFRILSITNKMTDPEINTKDTGVTESCKVLPRDASRAPRDANIPPSTFLTGTEPPCVIGAPGATTTPLTKEHVNVMTQQINEIFRALDKDRDGKISRKEFIQGLSNTQKNCIKVDP